MPCIYDCIWFNRGRLGGNFRFHGQQRTQLGNCLCTHISSWLALQQVSSLRVYISWGWLHCCKKKNHQYVIAQVKLKSLSSNSYWWLLRIRNRELCSVVIEGPKLMHGLLALCHFGPWGGEKAWNIVQRGLWTRARNSIHNFHSHFIVKYSH